jgi:hypothetical protein
MGIGPTLEGELAGRPVQANRPEDRTLEERCITTGGVFMPNPFYNNYHQIVQAPGYVAIVTEMMYEVRVISLDRRQPLGDGIRQWLGDSRGWWEGQTLVVETRNFNDKRLLRGATRELTLVERFTRVGADTLRYQLTVSDPATFTQRRGRSRTDSGRPASSSTRSLATRAITGSRTSCQKRERRSGRRQAGGRRAANTLRPAGTSATVHSPSIASPPAAGGLHRFDSLSRAGPVPPVDDRTVNSRATSCSSSGSGRARIDA